MSILNKRFYSFEVELELYEENGEPRSSCFIRKGNACSSLAAVEAFGVIDDNGLDVIVPDSIFTKIDNWAHANGY
jgi:hypothetical protein